MMPIETDSGYLPDWLKALLGQGGMEANTPTGLFADTAASPSPAVGLLSNLPQFTGVKPDAPAFGSGPSNSYPSMAMPQDPGPMNIGPGGAPPAFGGVRPDAPFMASGPAGVQDQYANVPLPPRRPNDLTSFQAMAPAGAPQDINAPPPGQPNSNVVGTAASGAPEVTAQKSQGLGDYLGKAADLVGGIYGAGGPGDALIALGLSNRTNGASIQALNSMNANRVATQNMALKQAALTQKAGGINATRDWLINYKGVTPDRASSITAALAGGVTKPLDDAVKEQPDTSDIKNYEYWKRTKPESVDDPGFAAWVAEQKSSERGPRVLHPGDILYSAKGDVVAKNESATTMDPDTIESLAKRVVQGDTTALQNLGRGHQTAENIAAVQARVAQLAKDLPEGEKSIIQNRMELAGKTAGARTAGVLNAKLDAFASEADSAIDLARETSRNLPRTGWTTLNKLIQAGQTESNDPHLAAHLAQTNAVVNTYAKAINPQSSGGALADREHARKLLAAAQSPEAFEATLNQMQREIRVAHSAIRNLGTLRDQPVEASGAIPPPPAGTPGASSVGVLQAGQDWLRSRLGGAPPQAAPTQAARPARVVTPPTPEMRQQLLRDAREAISKNAPADAVRSKLLSLGVDPKDL